MDGRMLQNLFLYPSIRLKDGMDSGELGTFLDPRTVRFERVLSGPIERVWAYLTSPELLSAWLAGARVELYEGGRIELRIGGRDSRLAPPPAIVRGIVMKCRPPHLLSYTWTDPHTPASFVTFELEPTGLEVRLVLTHRRLARGFLSAGAGGWHSLLGALGARLRGEIPEPFQAVFDRVFPSYEARARAFGEGR